MFQERAGVLPMLPLFQLWVFPHVTLEDWGMKELVALVVRVVTHTMFNKHYYSFGGGPTGLWVTCAVMQIFDKQWGVVLKKVSVKTHGTVRYMGDIRIILPPFKPGWRWVGGSIKFCLVWNREDKNDLGWDNGVN